MKYLHRLVSFLGFALGGAEACLKYGCKECCSSNPVEHMKFHKIGEWKIDSK